MWLTEAALLHMFISLPFSNVTSKEHGSQKKVDWIELFSRKNIFTKYKH